MAELELEEAVQTWTFNHYRLNAKVLHGCD